MTSIQEWPAADPSAANRAAGLFEDAPPNALQRRLGLMRPGNANVRKRALLVALVGWTPLVVLSLVQSAVWGTEDFRSLLHETGVHARYLLAAPLLIVAEAVCIPRLQAIVRNFADSGIVPDLDGLNAAIAATRRRLASKAAEVAIIVLAYLVVAAAAVSSLDTMPAWHRTKELAPVFSPAGWWHILVSLPLMLTLIFGWVWRLAQWAGLLAMIARLDLRLVASHPDQAGGLSFVGHSVRAFSMVALAIAVIAAGRSARFVIEDGTVPTPNLFLNLSLLAAVLLLLVAPLFCFTPLLLRLWQNGSVEYGTLAKRVGAAFEDRWIGPNAKVDDTALEAPDFSATTDLYQVVSNVLAMRFVPVDSKDLITLAAAMLAPFVPVVLLAVPPAVILSDVKGLLF